MKGWYKDYSRKIEAIKSEESFAMTLRQVWRFLRDTHIISANSTIAQFDRLYNMGEKNHFLLLSSKDKEKFDRIYGVGPDGYKPKAPEEVVEEVKSAKEPTPQKPKEERKKNQGMIGGPDELE